LNPLPKRLDAYVKRSVYEFMEHDKGRARKLKLRSRGITQQQVATRARVTQSMVSKVLGGKAKSRVVEAAVQALLRGDGRTA
jgi:transcriptional regulator with XRE-family HTH domain